MPTNAAGNLTYQDVIGKTGKQIAGKFGFDPGEYGQYFQGYGSIQPELGYIQKGFESQAGGMQQEGAQSMFDLASQARGLEVQGGFSNFGALQKSLGQTQASLQEAMNRNLMQAGMRRDQAVYGTQKSFFDEAIQNAIQLLQTGAEADWEGDSGDDSVDGRLGVKNREIIRYNTDKTKRVTRSGTRQLSTELPDPYNPIYNTYPEEMGFETNMVGKWRPSGVTRSQTGTRTSTGEGLAEHLSAWLDSGRISQRDYDWLWRQIYLNEWNEDDIGEIDNLLQEMGGENFNYQDYGG